MQKKSKGRILSITRICGYCGNPFEAHNSTTRFFQENVITGTIISIMPKL